MRWNARGMTHRKQIQRNKSNFVHPVKMVKVKGWWESRWMWSWARDKREVSQLPSSSQRVLVMPQSWWCWSRSRRWRRALCIASYLLEALLVPGLTIDTVAGNLPPIWDILVDLRPIAIPLAPLVIGLRRREANLVLLKAKERHAQHY